MPCVGVHDALFSDEVFGFHAQQAAEKCLKAWIASLGTRYPRTHDLMALIDELSTAGADTSELDILVDLNPFAVEYRSLTVLPLAMGERIGSRGRRVLITRGLEEWLLGRYLETDLPLLSEVEQLSSQHQVAAALGVFVARLHEAGIAHNDLHVANIMIRHEVSGPALFLLDLEEAAPPLLAAFLGGQSRQFGSLESLFQFASGPTACALACLLPNAFCEQRPCAASSAPVAILVRGADLAAEVEEKTWLSNVEFWSAAIAAVAEPIVTTTASTTVTWVMPPLRRPGRFARRPVDPVHATWSSALQEFAQLAVALFEMEIVGQKRQVVLKRFSPAQVA